MLTEPEIRSKIERLRFEIMSRPSEKRCENSLSKRPWEGREVNNCYHPATGKVRWVTVVTLIAV